jgi:hypothetical protein
MVVKMKAEGKNNMPLPKEDEMHLTPIYFRKTAF